MTLTQEQMNFFKTFGFLHLKGVLKNDLEWIVAAYESIHKNGPKHPKHPNSVVPFVDHDERLCGLLTHPVVEGVAQSLLGRDFNYVASDGSYYSGDTGWHSDGWWDTESLFVKFAFYLDPLTYSTGALRVIPGSHIISDKFAQDAQQQVSNSQTAFGIHGRDIPAVALETMPGDLAIFNHNCKHASFGGGNKRRMFTLNLGQEAKTPEQIERLKKYLSIHIPHWAPTTHVGVMRSTADENRMRHLRTVIENEAHVAELHQKTLQPANA